MKIGHTVGEIYCSSCHLEFEDYLGWYDHRCRGSSETEALRSENVALKAKLVALADTLKTVNYTIHEKLCSRYHSIACTLVKDAIKQVLEDK